MKEMKVIAMRINKKERGSEVKGIDAWKNMTAVAFPSALPSFVIFSLSIFCMLILYGLICVLLEITFEQEKISITKG